MHPRATLALCLATAINAAHAEEPATAPETPQTPQTSSAEAHRFDIWEFQVEGNSLLERPLVERTVYPYLGPAKSVDDVEAARVALENFYRSSGYPTVVVDIPEQEVNQGIVRLKVVEGSIDRVRVSGSRYFSLGRIRAGVPALAEGGVPYAPQLQAQLQELNQASPDRSVTPIFRPGRTPGTVEVDLRVKDEFPLHADVEVNNRYSRDTSELRASASIRYANLWQREHSASLMYQTAPENPDDVRVLAGTYVWPLGRSRALAAYAVDSESDVATAGDLSVIGTGTILGLRYIQPLPARGQYYHSATLGMDYKDFEEDVLTLDGPGFNTPIDYVNFSGQYRGTWLGQGSRLTGGLSANFGLRGLGNSVSEFENKRFLAKPNYMYFGVFGEYTRTYGNDIQVHAALDAQVADSPLVSNEQYGAGGADSVRGYYESQALADDGVTANLELRSPSYAKSVPHVRELRFLGFLDAAKLRVRQPLPGQVSRYELYGAGVGFRIEGARGLDASFDWAWPLIDATGVEKGDARAHFRLHYGF
ncbi:MAG: ShlB/FhaC/HecB family hemolysin secretion/activation protein [Gammaproteobacteria bacterium]